MENSQLFNVPLDAPIDFDSADMLAYADAPTLSLNRQQYQGSILPNSLRYEHDGYFAGSHAHEFNLEAGNTIKDSTGRDYTVIKHQAYYAPIYHVESGAVSFDYYPLTTIVQSNANATITNKNDNTFDMTIGTVSFTVNKDTAAVTGSGITVVENIFDQQLFTFDIAVLNNNESVNIDNVLYTGKSVTLGYDQYLYSYANGTHKWGSQFYYDTDLHSADGTIKNVTVEDSRITFDYSCVLETSEELQIVTNTHNDYIYNSINVNTDIGINNYNITSTNDIVDINTNAWYTIMPLHSQEKKSVQLPTLLDNDLTRFNAVKENNKMYIYLDTGLLKEDLWKILKEAIKEDFGDTNTYNIAIDIPCLTIDAMTTYATNKNANYTYSVDMKSYNDYSSNIDAIKVLYTITYNSMFTRFNTSIKNVKIYMYTSSKENAEYIININDFPSFKHMTDYTQFSLNNWHYLYEHKDELKDVDLQPELKYYGRWISSVSQHDIIVKKAPSTGILSDAHRIAIRDCIDKNITNATNDYYCNFNTYEDLNSSRSSSLVRLPRIEDPYIEINNIYNKDTYTEVPFSIRLPVVTAYAKANALYDVTILENTAIRAQKVTVRTMNGTDIAQGIKYYCSSKYTQYIGFSNIMLSLSLKNFVINTRDSADNSCYKFDGALHSSIPASDNIDKLSSMYASNYYILQPQSQFYYILDGRFLGGYICYSFLNETINLGSSTSVDVPLIKRINCENGSSYTNYSNTKDIIFHAGLPDRIAKQLLIDEYITLSEYMKQILKPEVVSDLSNCHVPYAFLSRTIPVAFDSESMGKIYIPDWSTFNHDAILNINKWCINLRDAPNSWQHIENDNPSSYYMLQNDSYIEGSVPLYMYIKKSGYLTFLIKDDVVINATVSDKKTYSNIVDEVDHSYISINDTSIKVDSINNKAACTVTLNGLLYTGVNDAIPDAVDHIPEYIAKENMAYAYVSNDYYNAAIIDNKNNFMQVVFNYTIDPTYSITAATVTPESEWQHGLANSMTNNSVSFTDNSVTVSCEDADMSYTVSFDQKTQEASCSSAAIVFKQEDVGKYNITKKKGYSKFIELRKAHSDNMSLLNVIDNTYTLRYDNTDIIFNTNNESYIFDSPFGNYNIEDVVFNYNDIAFNFNGKKSYTATVTVNDIYNLKGITRKGVNNGKINFN